MAFMNWIMYRKVLKAKDLADEMFDYRTILNTAAILMVAGFLVMALYNMPTIRYALVITMLIIIFFVRDRIAGLVMGLRVNIDE